MRDATIITPSFDLQSGMIDGYGTIIGNVTTYPGTVIQLSYKYNLNIVGDVRFNGGEIRWSFTTNTTYYGDVEYAKIMINGTIYNGSFTVNMQLNGFMPLPTIFLPLVHFTKNMINVSNIADWPSSEFNQLIFSLNGNVLEFEWVIVIRGGRS